MTEYLQSLEERLANIEKKLSGIRDVVNDNKNDIVDLKNDISEIDQQNDIMNDKTSELEKNQKDIIEMIDDKVLNMEELYTILDAVQKRINTLNHDNNKNEELRKLINLGITINYSNKSFGLGSDLKLACKEKLIEKVKSFYPDYKCIVRFYDIVMRTISIVSSPNNANFGKELNEDELRYYYNHDVFFDKESFIRKYNYYMYKKKRDILFERCKRNETFMKHKDAYLCIHKRERLIKFIHELVGF